VSTLHRPALLLLARRARGTLAFILALAASGAAACTPPHAEVPGQGTRTAAEHFGAAFEAEARDSAEVRPYLDLVDRAVAEPREPHALQAAIAALDALVVGAAPGVDVQPGAVAFRAGGVLPGVVMRLGEAWAVADVNGRGAPAMPFLRGAIAGALHQIALYAGDEKAALVWGMRRGCAQEAAVVGPIDWTPLQGLEGASPVGTLSEPFERTYPGVAPFAAKVAPVVVRADSCSLDVDATSVLQGTRAVVVDVYNPAPQRLSLSLTSASAAVVEIGGVRALRRGFEAGGKQVVRLATVQAEAGWLRVVTRVAQKNDGDGVELNVWGEDGLPLRVRAPRPGQVAGTRASQPAAVELAPAPKAGGAKLADAELALQMAALLGMGEARTAEHLFEVQTGRGGPKGSAAAEAGNRKIAPALTVLYARAVAQAEDLPDTKVTERLEQASAQMSAAWPWSWEARMLAAYLVELRRGEGEGVIGALEQLGVKKPPAAAQGGAVPAVPDADRLVLAKIALAARRAGLADVSEAAYRKLAAKAAGSALLAEVDAALHPRIGKDAVRAECADRGRDRSSTACLEALREVGDHDGVFTEIARLRRLRRAPDALREVEMAEHIARGDLRAALAVHDAMLPANRRLLDALGLAAGRSDHRGVRGRLTRDRAVARDAPNALQPVSRVLGLVPDPAPPFEAHGRKLVLEDQKNPAVPGAATLVLRHVERYDVAPDGLLHYVTYDLRRVSGTTDVAMGAAAYGPMIEGRGAPKLLRRRIHKKDGRILTPDAAAYASQGHSDLSQLEQGDYVEQITEGYALPSDTGQLVIDTSDLLPERTSVREAEIEVRRPASVPFMLWSHPLLGKAEQREERGTVVSVWRIKDRPPRRIEDGVPGVEQAVAVSMGTQTWANVARALGENVRSLEDRDPYVARWAAVAAGADKTPSRALVERVVTATGKAIKVAGGAELSDISAVFGGGAQRTTARTILELGQGSRSWVIYRALRELGVKADLAIAETEPFSASPEFPPHVGRFRHPLVIARLGGAEGDVWIDADVEGPPLPPGRVSPELRGRSAMLMNGQIVAVQAAGAEAGDEVDIRLAIDAEGNARGTFTILLRGRAAQSLSEAFETVVGTSRREMLRDVVLGWVPWADVEEVVVSSGQGSWEVALRAKIAIHGFARPEGKGGRIWTLPGVEPVHLSFPRGFAGTLGATYASRGARQSALSIETSLQYHVRRRIELPAGMAVSRPPGPVNVDAPQLQAARKGDYGAVIEEDFRLSLPTGTVSAEEYQGFVDRVQAIDSGFMAGIRVEKKP